MPARTTPMMLVHVYSETPMNGARIRPARISRISVQQLAIKTVRYAISGGIGLSGYRRVFLCSRKPAGFLPRGYAPLDPRKEQYPNGAGSRGFLRALPLISGQGVDADSNA